MLRAVARIRNAWNRHGPAGFVRLIAYNAVYYAGGRARRVAKARRNDRFDDKYGTETAGIREIGSLRDQSAATRFAVQYQPSSEGAVRGSIRHLNIPFSDFIFIDFGSGKGRVLLVAAEFSFRQVIGIEFSDELHKIASANIAKLPADLNTDDRVRSIHGEAGEVALPRADLVCYLYNPFGAPVLERVVGQIIEHHRRHRCRIFVIYVDPRHRSVFERTSAFTVVREHPGEVIWECTL